MEPRHLKDASRQTWGLSLCGRQATQAGVTEILSADLSVQLQAHLSPCPTRRLQACRVLQSHLCRCILQTNWAEKLTHRSSHYVCSVFRTYLSKHNLKLLGLQSPGEKQSIICLRIAPHKHMYAPPYEEAALGSPHLLCS